MSQLDQLGGLGILSSQPGESLVDREKVFGRRSAAGVHGFERDATALATAFDGPFRAGLIDQDAPHGLGSRSEEMTFALPLRFRHPGLTFRARNQAQVGLVDQGRCLEGLTGLFVGQFLRRQLPQLVETSGKS